MHGPSLFGKSASVYVVESLETTDILPGAFERAERREAIARCNKKELEGACLKTDVAVAPFRQLHLIQNFTYPMQTPVRPRSKSLN